VSSTQDSGTLEATGTLLTVNKAEDSFMITLETEPARDGQPRGPREMLFDLNKNEAMRKQLAKLSNEGAKKGRRATIRVEYTLDAQTQVKRAISFTDVSPDAPKTDAPGK
jgi:hypothetical protein